MRSYGSAATATCEDVEKGIITPTRTQDAPSPDLRSHFAHGLGVLPTGKSLSWQAWDGR
jgi:hypothetical protein